MTVSGAGPVELNADPRRLLLDFKEIEKCLQAMTVERLRKIACDQASPESHRLRAAKELLKIQERQEE